MRITVAMATYNGEKYIREQLDSILGGEVCPDEIVVSDDASTDGTYEILEEYRDAFEGEGFDSDDYSDADTHGKHVEFRLIRNSENLGFSANFKRAIDAATGDIIFLADQDDIWEPDKIKVMTRLMEKRQAIKVLGCSFTIMDRDGRTAEDYALLPEADIEEGRKNYPALFEKPRAGWSNNNLYHKKVSEKSLTEIIPTEIMFHNICQGACMAFRGNIRKEIIRSLSEEIPHDWQIAIIGAGMNGFYFYNKSLVKYRIHPDNAVGLGLDGDELSSEYRLKEGRDALRVVRMYMAYMNRTHSLTGWNGDQAENTEAASDVQVIASWPDRDAFEKADAFLEKYIDAMEKKDKRKLLMLSFNPLFAKLKMVRGRVGDLIYVFKRQITE